MAADQAVCLGILAVSGVWYALGVARARRSRPWWRHALFASALLVVALALASPLDGLAESRLWAHMLQHVLLMLVAPPLLLLAAPWSWFWRPLPRRAKRSVARAVVTGPRLAPLRAVAHALAVPLVAWLAFNLDMALWHVPALYDVTVRSAPVHYVEHVSFLVLGLLFWGVALDSPPFRSRLDLPGRIAYVTAGAIASWILAVVLAVDPHPLYAAYAHPHGSLSPVADQQLASGVMWGPGSIPYALVVFWGLYVWLGGDSRGRRARLRAEATRA
jgi:cytochrome c oxidase assembly factor CtaG